MYWYKGGIKRLLIVGLLFACIASCRPDVKEGKDSQTYFDIKGFFESDAARLSRQHLPVAKTVVHNGVAQTQKVIIANWQREFELFISSDINKPAWSSSYTVQKANGMLVYKAKFPDLKTRSVVIKLVNNKLKWIMIINYTKNMLYENAEKLTYFPDSLYHIQKSQQVRLLGKNLYDIKEVF